MFYFVSQNTKEELIEFIRLSKDNGVTAILFATKESAQKHLSEVYRIRHSSGLRIIEVSITDVSGTLEDSSGIVNAISSHAIPLMVDFDKSKDGK